MAAEGAAANLAAVPQHQQHRQQQHQYQQRQRQQQRQEQKAQTDGQLIEGLKNLG